jgi:multiple sugar transport system permease protein
MVTVDAPEVNRARAKSALLVADVFASEPRKDQWAKGGCCLRGLMLDGRRKSIQPMAERLPDGRAEPAAVRECVVANALYGAYNGLGLLNSYLGPVLADSTAGVPFAIIIARPSRQSIPREIIEAARVDGAGRLRVLRSVVLPVSTNALIAAAVFTFLFTWSGFLFALTLTTTQTVRPITLGIYQYIGAHTNQWNAIMATAVVASVPAALLLVVAQRYVAAGATSGALK